MRAAARIDDDSATGRLPTGLPFPVRWLLRKPADSIAGGTAVVIGFAILINALFLQAGPHPAPIFANKPIAVAAAPSAAADKIDPIPQAVSRSGTVAEIQRELRKRGFFNGAPDGIYGPKTDAAIRDFEQAAHMRPSAEPNEALLAAISSSGLRAQPAAPARNDPIAALLAPSARIVAIQRALTDFGYGPVMPTGVYDAGTRLAIERFERARKRPVTGQISDQLVRELAALTGRPLE